jgi:hypothetical protein
LFFQAINNGLQVVLAGANFGCGRSFAVDAAGGAVFDVEEQEPGVVLAGDGGGVAESNGVLGGVIERYENAFVMGKVPEAGGVGGHRGGGGAMAGDEERLDDEVGKQGGEGEGGND